MIAQRDYLVILISIKLYTSIYQHFSLQVELKLRVTTDRLELQLAEEQAARLRAEEIAQAAQMKSNDEIRQLREHLERAQRVAEELRQQAESGRCAIL